MLITCTLSNKRRKGVASIFGTIIFIGILFTTVIPMMLVMKQADTIFEQKTHEMEVLYQEGVKDKLERFLLNPDRGLDSIDVEGIKNVVLSELIKNVYEHAYDKSDKNKFALLSIGLIDPMSLFKRTGKERDQVVYSNSIEENYINLI